MSEFKEFTRRLAVPKAAFVGLAFVAWFLAWWIGTGSYSESHFLTGLAGFLDSAWPMMLPIGLAGFIVEKAVEVYADGKAGPDDNPLV